MSQIKFGYTKSKEGVLEHLEFGSFKWGQPNKFYLLNNLFEYLPLYIERNSLCTAVLKAIAKLLLKWHRVAINIKNFRLSGKPGVKYANENWKLFVKDDSNDDDLAGFMKNLYPIQCSRGTEATLLTDIRRMTYSNNSWLKYYSNENCGWWLEQTFPDISTDGYSYKYNKLTYLELENMLFVEYYNDTKYTSDFLEKLLLKEVIPVVLNTTFLEVKPFKAKFGAFKFGRRKFGELRSPTQFLIGSN